MSDQALELRRVFGSFATGVTVVSADTVPDGAIGMTVNSFSSLSLEPPLVLWNLQKSSDCYDAFMTAGHYGVNILHAGQEKLSRKFAGKGEHALDGVDWHRGASGCPLLDQNLASLECVVRQHYDGGDHTILVGEVLDWQLREGEPLIFYGGAYQRLRPREPE